MKDIQIAAIKELMNKSGEISKEDIQKMLSKSGDFCEPSWDAFELLDNTKYLYGSENFAIRYKGTAIFRIAGGSDCGYTLMTATTNEYEYYDNSLLQAFLNVSTFVMNNILGMDVRLEYDKMGRPFNILCNLKFSPNDIFEDIKEFAFLYVTVCLNWDLFCEAAGVPELAACE